MTGIGNSSEADSLPAAPLQSPDKQQLKGEGENDSSLGSPRKRRRLARLVSQDALGIERICQKSADVLNPEEVPAPTKRSDGNGTHCSLPCSLLGDTSIMKTHIMALRLEADLFPMRLILTRLMANPTHNRKGLFNKPVDPVALGLPDYHLIVTKPMDLGTVKKKLHAIAYQSRRQAADDIRLVFQNAMRYNPPHNIVHKCASELLVSFEASYGSLEPCVGIDKSEETSTQQGTPGETEPAPPQNLTANSFGTCLLSNEMKGFGPVELNAGQASATVCSAVDLPAPSASIPAPPQVGVAPRRKSRLPPFVPHSCESCQGRKCGMCMQGCLSHEPNLLVCSGSHCGGAKIRKGVVYFITRDGSRQYCEKCFPSLPPLLSSPSDSNGVYRYKQELLKRKNDEDIAESWIECTKCATGVHTVCAMYSSHLGDSSTFVCDDCRPDGDETATTEARAQQDRYTFLSGSELPVPVASGGGESSQLSADSLPKCPLSTFIEAKVQEKMKTFPNADKTVSVRVISESSRHFEVPDVVRRHFRMESSTGTSVKPPEKVHYNQKAITLFQKIDGFDVCIFCMYVQEYDGKDQYDFECPDQIDARHSNRVYIAYIDSVGHFRPRECRTPVYHEVLVSYLAFAKAAGFEKAQIWACPPSRGNNFVFWNHPASQRTPTQERLDAWYHGAISRAVDCGVVTDVKSLFESDFEQALQQVVTPEGVAHDMNTAASGRMLCPPLLEGDFWIEEASRIHQANISRNIKVRAPTDVCVWNVAPISCEQLDPCPAIQVATLLKDRIMTHPSSVHFRRPVNAAALKLLNYHKIIERPMDLGTIYSHAVLGEYQSLNEVVADVELMVANARKFNPVGHFVHNQAIEVHELFFQELSTLVKIWDTTSNSGDVTWETFAGMSMSLDATMDVPCNQTTLASTSVVIEDDRSSDGSRSLGSSLSTPSSPAPTAKSSVGDQQDVKILASSPKSRPSKLKHGKIPRKLDLLSDGPDAVLHSMVGADTWLLDKRPAAAKAHSPKKAKRRRSSISSEATIDTSITKGRRQSWLGEEVSHSVRKMRTSFFSCALSPKALMSESEVAKQEYFNSYVSGFEFSDSCSPISSPITDARYALLEFSQFRHLEFDTLRRAKHSTAMLLFHLQNPDAPGTVPVCTTCKEDIEDVRWHKVKKVPEKRRVTKGFGPKKAKVVGEVCFVAEELCRCCHDQHSNQDEFVPIPVSMKRARSL